MRRLLCLGVVLAGCWSDDPQINGLTPDQWAQLQRDLTLIPVESCVLPEETVDSSRCDRLAAFGQQVFFDPALSSSGMVSCGTCHDSTQGFIDSRQDNNVSLGVSTWTKHNAMPTVDLGLKYELEGSHAGFTWTGKFKTPGSVLELAIAGPPFSTTKASVAAIARTKYPGPLTTLFNQGPMVPDDTVIANLEEALDAYMFRISSLDAPFDRWLAGSDDAISDSAKRGFQVFVGRGICIECHRGAAFSDFDYRNTGVPQVGPHIPPIDLGRSDVTHFVADDGKFMTPSLRNVARTGPYMHDGSFSSLVEVVEFYRRGGGDGEYSGVKDPRITPLDLTDGDVQDLVEFLQALNGSCGALTSCNGGCVNPLVNFNNCGTCNHVCAPMQACEMGTCVTAGSCPAPLAPCATGCVDLENDPMNCGACGHACTSICMAGVCG